MRLLRNFKSLFASSKVDIAQRFELMRSAISGTMSNFYMARDRETGQIVGLKILDAKKTELVEARFRGLNKPSEGEIASQIEHRNVVKTLQYGSSTTGLQFIVMEFLDGPGLNSLVIGRSKLLDGNRLSLIRQAGEALAAVHKAGFIHRDICPRNFVASKDAKTLKLIDFGLTVPAKPEYMQPGNRTGTPNYMAPEVVRRKKTDQRLDIFSFGVTAYELFTFDLPWARGNTGKAAMSHDTDPVDIRELRPQIHETLARTIMSCLSSEPDNRPQTMNALLQQIAKVPSEDR